MKKYFILILVGILFSCSNSDDANDFRIVKIRIANISQHNFENITIHTASGVVAYENLNPTQISNYQTFNIIYKNDYAQLQADGIVFPIQFYMGNETRFESGSYTCKINANADLTQFTVAMVEEN